MLLLVCEINEHRLQDCEVFYPESAPLQNAAELRTLAGVSDVPDVSGRRPEVCHKSRAHTVLLFTTQCCLCNRVAACPIYRTIFKPEICHQLNSLSLSEVRQKSNILNLL